MNKKLKYIPISVWIAIIISLICASLSKVEYPKIILRFLIVIALYLVPIGLWILLFSFEKVKKTALRIILKSVTSVLVAVSIVFSLLSMPLFYVTAFYSYTNDPENYLIFSKNRDMYWAELFPEKIPFSAQNIQYVFSENSTPFADGCLIYASWETSSEIFDTEKERIKTFGLKSEKKDGKQIFSDSTYGYPDMSYAVIFEDRSNKITYLHASTSDMLGVWFPEFAALFE